MSLPSPLYYSWKDLIHWFPVSYLTLLFYPLHERREYQDDSSVAVAILVKNISNRYITIAQLFSELAILALDFLLYFSAHLSRWNLDE